MALFEKIRPERIEIDDVEVDEAAYEIPNLHQSSRNWQPGETLTVSYQPGMKLVVLLFPLLIVPFFMLFLQEGIFFLEIICMAGLLYCFWVIADCLLTRSFTFFPERIVKYGLLGRTEIPTSALVMSVNDHDVSLFHSSYKNLRESVRIRRIGISGHDLADLVKYVQDIYRVRPNRLGKDSRYNGGGSELAVREFDKAASFYRTMAAFFAIILVVAIFTVGFSDTFFGFAGTLPEYPVRLACIGLAIAAFIPLRRWASIPAQVGLFDLVPVLTRLKRADDFAARSAVLSVLVAALGLLLFVCFGNTLDLYLFLLAGGLYFYDCYPRLVTWERLVQRAEESGPAAEGTENLPRRSLQISLALMGALAVMSYGQSRNYVYANLKDCQDDWGDGQACEEASGGTDSYGGHVRYYGPRYGSGGGRPTRALGVRAVSRGGFGALGSFHGSFGG